MDNELLISLIRKDVVFKAQALEYAVTRATQNERDLLHWAESINERPTDLEELRQLRKRLDEAQRYYSEVHLDRIMKQVK